MDSITTLIVEDEPMLAEILVDNIKQFPQFDVIGIADKLESARKQLRLYQPQLILLDNFLPDGKGIDLIRHAVSTHYKGRIIFITADNHMETISEALRLGVFDYLIKPVHYQRLQHTLERFARYRSSLRSSEQASQLHVDALFNIQAREQTEPASAPLRGIDVWGGDRFCMRGSLPRKTREALRDKALGRTSRICTAGRKMRFCYDLCDEFCTITDC